MKLYTEEQVRRAMAHSYLSGVERVADYISIEESIFNQLTPIELPSNEEISIEASNRHYGTNFKHVFASGAKWMKEQILNQNK